jgi:hypothetical protein
MTLGTSASGQTEREGRNLVFRVPATWEHDLFGFLDEYLKQH